MLTATIAALQAEVYRSLNGVEKQLERGLDSLGARMDKLEDRALAQEKITERSMTRLEALEERARREDGIFDREGFVLKQSSSKAEADQRQLETWKVITGAILSTVTVIGVIAGVLSLFLGG